MSRRRIDRARLVAPLLLAAACATPPSTTVRETYMTSKTGDAETDSLTTLVELGTQQELGPGFQYRASERFLRTDLDIRSGTDESDTSTVLNQPSLDTILTVGALRWTQGLDYQRTESSQPSIENDLRRATVLEKLEWTPAGLPRVTAWFDGRRDEDSFFVDREDFETVLQVDDERGPFSWLYTLEAEDITDLKTDVERERLEHIVRGTYRDQFLDDRLTGSLSVFFNDRDLTTSSPTELIPGIPVALDDGLAAIDLTPEIGMLPSVPALADGDTGTGTSVNIGGFASGGELSWNVGVELTTPQPVNLLFLYTLDDVDPFLQDQFSFSVWTSDDNDFWTLVTGSAAYVYETLDRRFRILIPEVDARYVKVVNTASPPTAPAVIVTELEAVAPAAIGGDPTRVDDVATTANVNGILSWRARDDLTLSYDVFAQLADRESDGVATRDEQRLDHGVTALWSPSQKVDVRLRLETQDQDDTVRQDETFYLVNGLVDYRPLETLGLTFNYTGTRRKVDGASTLGTNAALLRATAQLLDTLQADLSLEHNLQEDFENARDVERFIVSSGLTAELTPTVDLVLDVREEVADVTGPGAGGIPDPSETEYEALLLYQPSDQLTTEIRLTWKDTFVGSGLEQRYRVDWVPFRDGAIDLQLDFDRNVTGPTQTEVDRYLALARWTFNPRTFLELNYARQDPGTGERTDSLTAGINYVR